MENKLKHTIYLHVLYTYVYKTESVCCILETNIMFKSTVLQLKKKLVMKTDSLWLHIIYVRNKVTIGIEQKRNKRLFWRL